MSKPRPPARGRPAPLPIATLADAERLACLRLIRTENVGPVTFRELVNHCGGAERALAALPDLTRRGGRRQPVSVYPRDKAEAELEAAHRYGARALFTIEPGYPAVLVHAGVPPPMLYVKGRTELFKRPAVAIVGARNASAAGRTMARQLAAGLGAAGVVIISGLARGIDAAAHEAAMATGTVAVLAGGIDHVYPPEHESLHAQIAAEGCLVTELPPGFKARGSDFPRRNRIVSGLSLGVVIVEAANRSGSLITARRAAEQGREVFAVPGHPLDPRAEGTNMLLKQGATLVTSAADVLETLGPQIGATPQDTAAAAMAATSFPDDDAEPPSALPPEAAHRLVLQALGAAPVSIDELARTTGLSIRTLRGVLIELALASRIEHQGAQLVALKVG
ncbi:MAG: DNA-processing protein DprA [Hyphomicrobiaceae bacterium]